VLDLADRHGLKVLLTLFDWTGDYSPSSYPAHRLHIDRFAQEYGNDPRVLGWDIQNESDHAMWADEDGNDPNLSGKPAWGQRDKVTMWINEMASRLRAGGVSQPISVGLYGHFIGTMQTRWMDGIRFDESYRPLLDALDFVMFHWYEAAEDLREALRVLSLEVHKPIVIEELGAPSIGVHANLNIPDREPFTEEKQRDWFASWMPVIDDAGISGSLAWCLVDILPDPIPEYHSWGLFRSSLNGYAQKPAAAVYAGLPAAPMPVQTMSKESFSATINAYPNPLRGQPLRVEAAGAAIEKVEMTIIDSIGRVVLQDTVPGSGADPTLYEWNGPRARGIYTVIVVASGPGGAVRQTFRIAVLK
jgi:hypothetical protein